MMSWKEAKKWAEEDPEARDWRDRWKYGQVVRGLGLKGGDLIVDWGPDATPGQKKVLEASIHGLSKWARKVEEVLDRPPPPGHLEILKTIKRVKITP